jgi:hypothetical protein
MYAYTVRVPFAGFAKGEVLSQAQIDAYEAKGGHVDHHAVRVARPAPSTVHPGEATSPEPA